jgi:hypothetical protein
MATKRLRAAVLGLTLGLAACEPGGSLADTARIGRGRDAATPSRAAGRAEAETAVDAGAPVEESGGPTTVSGFGLEAAVDCVRVRARASRPVTAALVLTVAGQVTELPLGRGAISFDAAVRVLGPPAAIASAQLVARDADGATLTSDATDFAVPAPGGPLVISEVLANPAGLETAQEFVEIVNLGASAARTAGLRIEDGGGVDELPDLMLAPGARALIVGAGYNGSGGPDVPPRAGTALLPVAGRIGRDGLGQMGEVVRLVDAEGRVLSAYGGWVNVSRPSWAGKSVHRQPDESACDHPSAWSFAPTPATPGW